MADISKIKLANGTVVTLKDAAQRTNFATLLGSNALAALKTAAWKDAQSTWSAAEGHTDELPTVAAVKSYVDAQIEAIPTFECVVCPADAAQIPAGAIYRDGETEITGTMAASASTYKKIYLVKDTKAGAGAYNEYITIRSGVEGSYTYSWEAIGSTVIDLSGYVKKTQKIAGIALSGDITVAQLEAADALNLKALSHKDSASTSYTPSGTISEVDATPAGSVTLNAFTQTATAATLTKGDFKPSGSITGSAISGGSINVTIKDAEAATAITDLTYDDYTPAGSVALTKDNESGTFQVSGTVAAPTITVDDSAKDTFVKSLKAGSVDAASINTAMFSGGSFTGATAATFTQGAKASFTQGAKASFDKGTAVAAATEGLVASVNTAAVEGDDDYELLTFTAAATDNVIGHDEATFTANGDDSFTANGDDSFTANNVGTFTAAAINDGFFSAQKLPVVDGTASAVTGVSATSSAPAFTGDKFTPGFTGTAAAVKLSGAKYLKQEIDEKTFTPTAATLGFEGTNAENVLVTAVSYDKATANGASFEGTTNKVTPTFSGAAATITVE